MAEPRPRETRHALPVRARKSKDRTLCLNDASGIVLWHEGPQSPARPVSPTVADVTGTARWVVIPALG
ncbi:MULTISPECIES: hypothetical protein [Streptomyces]|uniref:hypothetical protein n=1 Tax=Streptomyces TaxID=1883 RepID=UPI0029B7734D|nr:hypothetical protein [Streptomyces sp. ND04-05B]MDX3063289.1 hypothetical protein [Streptomyces sp. ND04-05B]